MQRHPLTFKVNAGISNKKMAIADFILQAHDQARHCSTDGILPLCMTAAEHLVLYPLGPAVILLPPGPMPGGAARHPWEHLNTAYETQQVLARQMLTHTISPEAGIPVDLIRSMHDGIHGLSNRDLPWIYAYLKNFSVLSPTDIDELMDEFALPWDSKQEIRTFVHDKQHLLRVLAANLCPINTRDVYVHAKKWFNPIHWLQCWNDHARLHSTLLLYNADDLFRDIILFRDTSFQHMTSSQAGYHAAAVTQHPVTTTGTEDAIELAVAAFMDKQKPQWTTYCWSHGPNNDPTHHSGVKGCRNPKPGHQHKATLLNRMGGK